MKPVEHLAPATDVNISVYPFTLSFSLAVSGAGSNNTNTKYLPYRPLLTATPAWVAALYTAVTKNLLLSFIAGFDQS